MGDESCDFGSRVGDTFELIVDFDNGKDGAELNVGEGGALAGCVAQKRDGSAFDGHVRRIDDVVADDDRAGAIGAALKECVEGFFEHGLDASALIDKVVAKLVETGFKSLR